MSTLLHRLLEGRERAMQMDAYRRLGTLEHPGDVVRRHILLDPKEHRGPLARGQPIYRRPQLLQHLLPAQLVYRIVDRRRLPVEDRVGPVIVVVANPEVPPLVLPLVVQTEVDQDPIEPGRELGPSAKAPRARVEPDEGILREIARVLGVPENGPGEAVRSLLIARHEELERRLVPPGHALAERFVRWLQSPVAPSPYTLSLPTVRRQVFLAITDSARRAPGRADPAEGRGGRHSDPGRPRAAHAGRPRARAGPDGHHGCLAGAPADPGEHPAGLA